MNLTGYEFQVIFCVLILLGLASVALVVDYLKGMNEKLRERQIDLMARHETVVNQVEVDNTRLLRALAEQSKTFREMTKNSLKVNTLITEDAPLQITQDSIPEPDREPIFIATGWPVAEPDPMLELLPSPVANTLPPVEDSLPSNVIRIRLKSNPDIPAFPPGQEEKQADFEKFLEDLVSEFEPGQTPPLPDSAAASLDNLSSKLEEYTDSLQLPIGMQNTSVLKQAMDRHELLSGLVVSVGINDYLKLDEIHGKSTAEELLNTVDGLMTELIGEAGFCTRLGDDEFVLIFPQKAGPGKTGQGTQQKLTAISERLWDYQLQALGTFTVVFSWGAHESFRQPLSDAVHAATGNMIETRINRKNSSTEPGQKQRATA